LEAKATSNFNTPGSPNITNLSAGHNSSKIMSHISKNETEKKNNIKPNRQSLNQKLGVENVFHLLHLFPLFVFFFFIYILFSPGSHMWPIFIVHWMCIYICLFLFCFFFLTNIGSHQSLFPCTQKNTYTHAYFFMPHFIPIHKKFRKVII